MLGPNEQRNVRVVSRQIVNGGISLLLQPQCPRRFSNYSSCDRYTHPALSPRNRDGMVRPRNSDLLAFACLSLHCAPNGTGYSFDPPSTGILAPVIQRALSEAKNATTSATSSGLPIRFSTCIPRVASRPASVFVKFDMSVSITPGATAFTRIPRGPRMAAQFLTRVSNAPLVEE